MSLLSRLFGGGGGGGASGPEPEDYKGFRITPEPQKEGAGYRIAARIEKEVGGEMKSHSLIRADVISAKDEAETASVNKAKQMIDEQGERLFG